jgi:hypothetical protein
MYLFSIMMYLYRGENDLRMLALPQLQYLVSNKFYNDGSFMREVFQRQNNDPGSGFVETESVSSSANQLAAKALQLRVKGKHEEANKLQVR